MRVSEIVTTDGIKKWNNGDIITIQAGTGAGKSYFIKNILYAFARKNNKKILMLLHRVNCVNQFQLEIERDFKTDTIHIKTYQHLEALYKNKIDFNFSEFEFIVCDEFHYFMSDAAFNKTTDISLDQILEQSNKTRIFMSATGDYMTRYLKHKKYETIDYKLPINYDFIDKLFFFNKDETMENYIKQAIEHNQKAIFFIQSATKAYELYKKFKDFAGFNCGKSDKHYKHVNENKINSILKNERFDELIFITTTCFDTGINLVDDDLKRIVIDVKDKGVLLQCLGRKRIQHKDDKVFLFIKNINNQSLGGTETHLAKKLEMAEFLKNHTVKEFINKYPRQTDYNQIVYDEVVSEDDKGTKKINELMYFKCLTDLNDISIIKTYGEYAYCKYFSRKFGFYDEDTHFFDYIIEEEKSMINSLEEYLDSIVGKIFLKVKDRQELIEKINVRDGNNNRLLKNIDTLNAKLKEVKINFLIEQFETSRMENGKKKNYKSAWRVLRLCDF